MKPEISMIKRRMAILSFSDISRDARVLRQIEYTSKVYDVDVIGYGDWASFCPNVRFFSVGHPQKERTRIFSKLKKQMERYIRFSMMMAGILLHEVWMKMYWLQPGNIQARKLLHNGSYDLIHANDLDALPVSIAAAERVGSLVLFDAHEYSPNQVPNPIHNIVRSRYASYLLRKFGSRADAFITVSEGIAQLYKKNFDINAQVIMNAPAKYDVYFKEVDPTNIRLIHHGAAARKRELERLIEVISLLDERFTLHFMLVIVDPGYIDTLKKLADHTAPGRVHFHQSVTPSDVVRALSDYDVGIHVLPPITLNHLYALPNKMFDFISAGLALAIGPSPEMAKFVREQELGVIANSFDPVDLAEAINSLTDEEINQMKRNSHRASDYLNSDIEMGKLMEMYRDLLG